MRVGIVNTRGSVLFQLLFTSFPIPFQLRMRQNAVNWNVVLFSRVSSLARGIGCSHFGSPLFVVTLKTFVADIHDAAVRDHVNALVRCINITVTINVVHGTEQKYHSSSYQYILPVTVGSISAVASHPVTPPLFVSIP